MIRIALAQIDAVVGDLQGNADKIIEWTERAQGAGADLVAFPELAITGYPPEDLVLKPDFIAENRRQLMRVAASIAHDITAVVGFVDNDEDIYNAAAVIQQGQIVGVHHKFFLPNYSVFDEQRYFKGGDSWAIYKILGAKVGVTVCEDIWYPVGPATLQAMAGADVIVNINASPYRAGMIHQRQRMVATRALDEISYVAYVNLIGGQDELVFEGNSMVFDWRGELIAQGQAFREDLVLADLDLGAVFAARLHDTRHRQTKVQLDLGDTGSRGLVVTPLAETRPVNGRPAIEKRLPRPWDPDEEIYHALVLGTTDYVRKNGFHEVVIGLSGGIDSSLTAAIAVDAVGPDNVIGVSMPSRYSSEHSRTDAQLLAHNLAIRLIELPIAKAFDAYLRTLGGVFEATQPDVTEENLQARIRGNLLMALQNKFEWLVLTTGNKSEMAVGYSTLYGDTAGGFSVLKDVFKTAVFRLARWRNARVGWDQIPVSIIEKAPSAELRPEQFDADDLPPYDILDPILEAYVEEDRSPAAIAARGYPVDVVGRVVRMVDRSEYKRRQAPPGIKITTRAFGKDRRLPITNWYRA